MGLGVGRMLRSLFFLVLFVCILEIIPLNSKFCLLHCRVSSESSLRKPSRSIFSQMRSDASAWGLGAKQNDYYHHRNAASKEFMGHRPFDLMDPHRRRYVISNSNQRTKCFSNTSNSTDTFCAPSVIIAGYEKCGTSALYYKLARHPKVAAHPKFKEYCPCDDSADGVWSWMRGDVMPTVEKTDGESMLLNGCIGMVSKPKALGELKRLVPKLKVLVALRNYADWAYSYYNYRCYPDFDVGCDQLRVAFESGGWKENRSVEKFGNMVQDIRARRITSPPSFRIIRPSTALYRPWLEKLISIVGKDCIKIVKQEDLINRPTRTLKEVAEFIEIEASEFPLESYTLISNTHRNPARVTNLDGSIPADSIQERVNSGKAINPETRRTLNAFWKDECVWLKQTFNIHYGEAC